MFGSRSERVEKSTRTPYLSDRVAEHGSARQVDNASLEHAARELADEKLNSRSTKERNLASVIEQVRETCDLKNSEHCHQMKRHRSSAPGSQGNRTLKPGRQELMRLRESTNNNGRQQSKCGSGCKERPGRWKLEEERTGKLREKSERRWGEEKTRSRI